MAIGVSFALSVVLGATVVAACGQAGAGEAVHVDIDVARAGAPVSSMLFGQNIEITRRGVWRGLGAEMVANRKFAAAADGVPARWTAFGEGTQVRVDTEHAFAGRQSARVEAPTGGGIAQCQEALAFERGARYAVRLHVRSDAERTIEVSLSDASGRDVLFRRSWPLRGGSEWQALTATFRAPATHEGCRMEIRSTSGGSFHVGAVSVQPADAFNGMRRDVVALLKALKPGMLRYPGGCYAEFYHWRDGLLPVDQRPPVGPTGLPFLLPDQDDYDAYEIGIDEFIALCRAVGAQPSITVRLSENTPDDAAAWVEYCNGGPETKWGKVRADRGHKRPYGVKTWFVGNELWAFGRGGLTDPAAAARETGLFAEAMKRVDPAIKLVGCTLSTPGEWNHRLIPEIAGKVDLYSAHDYLLDHFKGGLEDIARAPSAVLRAWLERARDDFRATAPTGSRTPIIFDEWNTMWGRSGSIEMGLYVGGVLNLLCREGAALDVEPASYFMPSSEGGIKGGPYSAARDPPGQVFALFAGHQGNRLIPTPATEPDDDLDVCASAGPDGRGVFVTIVNRNCRTARTAEIAVLGGSAQEVSAEHLTPRTVALGEPEFVGTKCALTAVAGGSVTVEVPAAGIAAVRIAVGRP